MKKIKISNLKRFNIIKDFTDDLFSKEPFYEIWTFDTYNELKETLKEHLEQSLEFEYTYLDLNKQDNYKGLDPIINGDSIVSQFKMKIISEDLNQNELGQLKNKAKQKTRQKNIKSKPLMQ